MEKLISDEKAFDAANVEISRLHDELFAAIATGASKIMVEKPVKVEVREQMATRGLKRVAEQDDIDAKKRKMWTLLFPLKDLHPSQLVAVIS